MDGLRSTPKTKGTIGIDQMKVNVHVISSFQEVQSIWILFSENKYVDDVVDFHSVKCSVLILKHTSVPMEQSLVLKIYQLKI